VHEVSGEIMESMNNRDGAIIEYKKAVEMARNASALCLYFERHLFIILECQGGSHDPISKSGFAVR
jgi:hypothetical protein